MVQGQTALLPGDNVYCSFNEWCNSWSRSVISASQVETQSGFDGTFSARMLVAVSYL